MGFRVIDSPLAEVRSIIERCEMMSFEIEPGSEGERKFLLKRESTDYPENLVYDFLRRETRYTREDFAEAFNERFKDNKQQIEENIKKIADTLIVCSIL